MLGHSYIDRLKKGKKEYNRHSGETLAESMNLHGFGIRPKFAKSPSYMVKDLYKLAPETIKYNPNIIILEIGLKDLCWKKNKSLELAKQLYLEIQLMFETYEHFEIVTVCQVARKWKTQKGDRSVNILNSIIDDFNYEFMRLTRTDVRIVRWRHIRLEELNEITSTDGTHPNTIGGYWLYLKSISLCTRYSKREMFSRRGKSIHAVVKRRKAIRKLRSRQKAERRAASEALLETDDSDDENCSV